MLTGGSSRDGFPFREVVCIPALLRIAAINFLHRFEARRVMYTKTNQRTDPTTSHLIPGEESERATGLSAASLKRVF